MDTQMQVVEMAMMMETQALDLYLRFLDKVSGPEVKNTLYMLADEEKGHLKRLGGLMDRLLQPPQPSG
jgi:rubrerythrin